LSGNVVSFLGDLKDKAEDAAEDLASNAKGLAAEIQEKTSDENIKKASNFLNTDVRDIASDLKEKAEDLFDKLKDKE
jgi:uncharacterized protein YjbJ (UPF0337 family)